MSLRAARFFNELVGAVHLAAIGSACVNNSFKILDLEVGRWKYRINCFAASHWCTD